MAALDVLVVGVRDALGADTVAVMLAEDSSEGPVLVMYAWRGRAADMAPARIPVGHGVLGRIAERRETMVLDNVKRLGDMPSAVGSEQIVSVIGVPVVDQRTSHRGALRRVQMVGRFVEDDRHLLELIAAGAGPTISRARLADALDLYRRQLESQTGELEATASELELTVAALRRANAELAATAESARARTGCRRSREPREVRVPRDNVTRAENAAQCDPWLRRAVARWPRRSAGAGHNGISWSARA